ncbi:MAG: hypothetical protein DCC50_05600 [Acidobacteria bacterium]|nr:MAG: hypothetical protein DCC50_05600 [Acidobacteriota bacterium]
MNGMDLCGLVDAVQERISTQVGLSFEGPRGAIQRQVIQAQLRRIIDRHPGLPEESVALAPVTLRRICEELTVQESFFYREQAALDWFCHHVLPTLRGRRRPLAAWSAGCAEGQEVYTLAAVLEHAGLRRYRILGTDLSGPAVTAARCGVYGLWSLRGLDHSVVPRLFREGAGHFTVRERFRAQVTFAEHNLLDAPPRAAGGYDLVLCRNVLIYLTPAAQRRAVAGLTEALAPGGWLLTGAGDPLLDGAPGLATVLTGHGAVYRRADGPPVGAGPQEDARRAAPAGGGSGIMHDRSAPATAGPPHPSATVSQILTIAEEALESARPGQAERLAREALARHDESGRGHALLVQALVQSGRPAEAVRASARAVDRRPFDAALWTLHAVVLLDTGDAEAAAPAAERATSLDPGMAQAHLVLARSRAALGDRDGELHARAVGRELLEREAVSR